MCAKISDKLYIHHAQKTDIGRVRVKNEDAVGTFETPNGLLFVLCDGMGGHVGGAMASQMAVEGLYRFFNKKKYYRKHQDLFRLAVEEVNTSICHKIEKDKSFYGMGTTMVAAIFTKEGKVSWAHVGDSRLYRLRGGIFQQMTKDHSFVQYLIDQGLLSTQEASVHPRKNEITRALGSSAHEADVSTKDDKIQTGDTFLICSDGLNNALSDEQIKEVLLNGEDLEAQITLLISQANQIDGGDNISVQLISIKNTPPKKTEREVQHQESWLKKWWPF